MHVFTYVARSHSFKIEGIFSKLGHSTVAYFCFKTESVECFGCSIHWTDSVNWLSRGKMIPMTLYRCCLWTKTLSQYRCVKWFIFPWLVVLMNHWARPEEKILCWREIWTLLSSLNPPPPPTPHPSVQSQRNINISAYVNRIIGTLHGTLEDIKDLFQWKCVSFSTIFFFFFLIIGTSTMNTF